MKATNYLEVVGLILIGVALDRVINQEGNTAIPLAIDLGLSQHWNDNRFIFVALTCLAVALTLVVFQNIEREEEGAESRSAAPSRRGLLVSALHGIAFGLQIIIPALVSVLFEPSVGASLFIGFVLVDASLFIERYLEKRGSAFRQSEG